MNAKIEQYFKVKSQFPHDRFFDKSHEEKLLDSESGSEFFKHWYFTCCFDFAASVWRETLELNKGALTEKQAFAAADREKGKVMKLLQIKQPDPKDFMPKKK